MNPGEVSSQEQTQPQITEQHIQQLFGEHDNLEVFNLILEQAPDEYLPELTAAYFLRAHYTNGAGPPSELPVDHPLYQKIMGLDVDTVDDPVQKQVFTLLKNDLTISKTHPVMEGMLQRSSTALMLMPGLIEKHSVATDIEIFDVTKTAMLRSRTRDDPHIHIETLLAVGRKITGDSPESEWPEEQAFDRLKLAHEAAYSSGHFASRDDQQLTPSLREELAEISTAFSQITRQIMQTEMEMSPEVAEIVAQIINDPEHGHKILQNSSNLHRLSTAMKKPEVVELITTTDSRYPKSDIKGSMIKKIISGDNNFQNIEQVAAVLADDETIKTADILGSGRTINEFIGKISESDEPAEALRSVRLALENPAILRLIQTQLTAEEEYAGGSWEMFASDLIYNPSGTVELFDAIEKHGLTQKLLDNPSQALPVILRELVRAPDQVLAVEAGSSIIADNYAQASKLSDPTLIDHYRLRIEAFVQDIRVISENPSTLQQYKDFISSNQNSSTKQQTRAARVFKAVQSFGPIEIGQDDSIDAIETKVIDSFLTRLLGEEVKISDEERSRLVESFGEIAPLFTYAQQFINRPEMKQAIGELTKAVASGNYSQWHRGDGSAATLESMKQAGYLPINLTLEQYQEWIHDRSYSSEEELISSAEDTALAIRQALVQASVDINLLAPGYTIDIRSLDDVIAARNGLGRMTGMLHKIMKQNEGQAFSQESIDSLQGSLGEFADNKEVQNLIELLRSGTNPQEVAGYLNTTRSHLDQLRLIIRMANISPEEIVAGALLSEPDENGKRKAQEQLFDTLNELRGELPEELQFIPDTALRLLADHAQENGQIELLSVEDTIDPQVTIEIGETPQRSCQHYQTGGYNEGLIGYFDPEVKIAIVRNSKGGIIARVITRIMENENGGPVLFSEPIYQSVTSTKVSEMINAHLDKKAEAMGVEHKGSLSNSSSGAKRLRVKALKMPAVYSDSAQGINHGEMTVTA